MAGLVLYGKHIQTSCGYKNIWGLFINVQPPVGLSHYVQSKNLQPKCTAVNAVVCAFRDTLFESSIRLYLGSNYTNTEAEGACGV